jgi:hypothetical protein
MKTPSLYGITGPDGSMEAFTADRTFVAKVTDKDVGGAIIRAVNGHDEMVAMLREFEHLSPHVAPKGINGTAWRRKIDALRSLLSRLPVLP